MYSKILVPIDLSDQKSAKAAIEKASAIAKINDAEIHVLSIFPDFGTSVVSDFFGKGYQQEALEKLGHQLQDFVKEAFADDVSVRPHVVHGSIYEEVISATKKLGCDLIVMGSHRPELSDYLLGPNAARVVRHSPVSVLVVRG